MSRAAECCRKPRCGELGWSGWQAAPHICLSPDASRLELVHQTADKRRLRPNQHKADAFLLAPVPDLRTALACGCERTETDLASYQAL